MRRIRQRGAFLLGLITLVMFTAACSSPGPQELVSKRYQVQVTAPKGWDKVDAQFAWDGKGPPGGGIQGSGDFAYVADPGNEDRKFGVAAIPVVQGMHLTAWQAAMARFVPVDGCVNSGSVRKTRLGGEPALTWAVTCGDLHPTPIVALHGGRGYLAIVELKPPDPRIVGARLRSFHFTG
jgi:hypothetical protein